MSNERQPRHVNTGSAHGSSQSSGRKISRSSAARPAAPAQQQASRPAPVSRANPKKKKSAWKPVLVTLICILLILAAIFAGIYKWVARSIRPDGDAPTISEIINTPDEYKGDVVNVLVCGIREGMTDMIMYVNFDVANKKINMFQIPRDTYPGEDYKTGGTGKINAIASMNGGMASLVELIYDQYKLPIDYYVSIDIASLRDIVDVFGGIEVYVPRDMEYKGSVLKQGMRNLKGDALEFFLRNRHGDGYAEGDLARLDMQRYFYQALFERIRTATVFDLAKLTPVALSYVETDIPVKELISMGVSFLQVDSANIMMCKAPVYGAAEKYNGQYSIVVADPVSITELLNTYFRTYGGPVDQLNIPTLPTAGGLHQANVQYMGQLDTQVESQQSSGQ